MKHPEAGFVPPGDSTHTPIIVVIQSEAMDRRTKPPVQRRRFYPKTRVNGLAAGTA